MMWAAAHGQGAPSAVAERAAAQFLTRPDVHRAPDSSETRLTTSDLIAHAEARAGGPRRPKAECWLRRPACGSCRTSWLRAAAWRPRACRRRPDSRF
jgi:hypothetical protein